MGLILPSYLMRQRRYKCDRCEFRFIKVSPSDVERCPMCEYAAYDIKVDRKNLNPYSKTKERWYKTENKDSYKDEIRRRKTINGEAVVTDSRGRTIEIMPKIPLVPPDPKPQKKFRKIKL